MRAFVCSCTESGCTSFFAINDVNRSQGEKEARRARWKKTSGAWYCPEHRKPSHPNDKAPLFLHYWKLLALSAVAPMPEYQFDDTRNFSADYAFVDQRLIVEIDGGQFKQFGGSHGGDKDREKLNRAAVLGWRVIRISVQQMEKDPLTCIELVLEALA